MQAWPYRINTCSVNLSRGQSAALNLLLMRYARTQQGHKGINPSNCLENSLGVFHARMPASARDVRTHVHSGFSVVTFAHRASRDIARFLLEEGHHCGCKQDRSIERGKWYWRLLLDRSVRVCHPCQVEYPWY